PYFQIMSRSTGVNQTRATQQQLSETLYEDRNTESHHQRVLDAAQDEHNRVRAKALFVFEVHLQELENERKKDELRRVEEVRKQREEEARLVEEYAKEKARSEELLRQAAIKETKPRKLEQSIEQNASTAQTRNPSRHDGGAGITALGPGPPILQTRAANTDS